MSRRAGAEFQARPPSFYPHPHVQYLSTNNMQSYWSVTWQQLFKSLHTIHMQRPVVQTASWPSGVCDLQGHMLKTQAWKTLQNYYPTSLHKKQVFFSQSHFREGDVGFHSPYQKWTVSPPHHSPGSAALAPGTSATVCVTVGVAGELQLQTS